LPGDQVEEGTLLAELDASQIEETALTRRFDLQLTEVALLMAQLRLAQTGVPSVTISTDMMAEEILSKTGLERALLDLEVEMARLRVEKARALNVLSSERLSSTLFTAPFSGIIVSLEKGPGNQVRAYEPFGALANPSELWIIATVLEEDIGRLAREKSVTVRLDAYPEEEYSATVLQIPDQAIVWQSQNAYEVIITFDKGQEVPATIRMGANISIAGQSREDVLVVPTRAIITIGEQSYVEVTRDDGKIERVMVQTGLSNVLETEIVAGLQVDQVVHIP
jgi:RND family efflux transporter MFP subunit